MFENVEVEWVHGHAPTAYIYDPSGMEVAALDLGDKDLEQLMVLCEQNGFVPQRPSVVYPEQPSGSGSYGGHYYEVFSLPNFFSTAMDFAQSRTRGGLRGYPVTLTSAEENGFVVGLLVGSGVNSAWLGGSDEREEGKWIWLSGDQALFWEGQAGESVLAGTYINWSPGEPNNVDNEDCIVLSTDGHWNDVVCSNVRAAVVIEYGDGPLVEQLPVTDDQTPPAEEDRTEL